MRAYCSVGAACLVMVFVGNVCLACETTRINATGILDRRSATLPASLPSPSAPMSEQLSASQSSLTSSVYDSAGGEHHLDTLFFHTNDLVWVARVLIDGGQVVGGTPGQPFLVAEVSLYFDSNGTRQPDVPNEFVDASYAFVWASGVRPSLVKFAFRPLWELAQPSQLAASQDGRGGACPQYGILDFDGDGTDDFAIWRPATGMWAVRRSSTGSNVDYIWKQWGLPGDYPMPGDYTGDGLADLVVYRIQTGMWYVCRSEFAFDCSYGIGQQFGWPGDRPIRGDFDGDRILDFAVYRPSWLMFFYRSSETGQLIWQQWGLPGDIPLNTGVNR